MVNMRSISGQLTTELTAQAKGADIAKAEAFHVKTYREVMEHVARLAYVKDHLQFFRGQDRDYRNKAGASTIGGISELRRVSYQSGRSELACRADETRR